MVIGNWVYVFLIFGVRTVGVFYREVGIVFVIASFWLIEFIG